MEKLFFIDLETTGVVPGKHGIVQFAGFVQIDGILKQKVNFKCKPFPDKEVTTDALEVIGYTEKQVRSFPDPTEKFAELKAIMEQYVDPYDKKDKFHFVGYNARFDDNFLREFWKDNEEKYYGAWFHWPAIDITNLVALRYLPHRSKFPNYKLMTVCEAMGMDVDEEKAHDAFYDIKMTRELFNGLRKMVGWTQ